MEMRATFGLLLVALLATGNLTARAVRDGGVKVSLMKTGASGAARSGAAAKSAAGRKSASDPKSGGKLKSASALKSGLASKSAGPKKSSAASDKASIEAKNSSASNAAEAAQTPDATTAETNEPPAPSAASLALTETYARYKMNPSPEAFSEVVRTFKTFIGQNGKIAAAALIKSNGTLTEMGAKAINAGAGRVWIFQRVAAANLAVVQWADTKANVTFVGRRHRIKKVTYTSTWHTQEVSVPPTVVLKDARVMSSLLVLVGDERGSALWLRGFRPTENGWVESPSHFESIPSFLRNNVSGKIAFRGPDLIFNVARVVPSRLENGSGPATLPEAESSTYKFLLHLTENGYVLDTRLPEEEQFGYVRQFLDAVASSRTDVAKSLVADPKLLSIPKYVGIRGKTSAFRVTEMASPPSGAARFRLVTGMKDDLIFDVGKYKDKTLVKAIFIAPPDNFLRDIAKVLTPFDRIAAAKPVEDAQSEAAKPRSPN